MTLINVTYLTLQSEETGEIRKVIFRPCEECGTEMIHDIGVFTMCAVCWNESPPVVPA